MDKSTKQQKDSVKDQQQINAVKSYLTTDKNDAFYNKNVAPLFPKGSEPSQNAMSKQAFESFAGEKDNVNLKGILASGNKQMIVRVYQSVLEKGLGEGMESKVAQQNFKAFEKGVQDQIKSQSLDPKYLPDIVKNRIAAVNAQGQVKGK